MDECCYMPRVPAQGETLHCTSYEQSFGGKGANQAIMIGKLGGHVRLIALVGNDANGLAYIENCKRCNVDTNFVRQAKQATGFAQIWVSEACGDNRIVIHPGAAACMDGGAARKMIEESCLEGVQYVVCQNEIPLEATLHFLHVAHELGKVTIFNPAPAVHLPDACLEDVSVLVMNEHEASIVSGFDATSIDSLKVAVGHLRARGAQTIIVTLGANGCLLFEAGQHEAALLPCPKVENVVDTTGAGDCWVGCLTYFLSRGKPLVECCRRANAIAAMSVTKKGTQKSFPLLHDIGADFLS
eukprot:GGOE01013931.1.p1 GENE.GGOE01013931.1~~GGOE01013931.1.p1  ORF type:complete len:318 (-),score=12.55 GGOE01013931.1:81-977(-)